MNLLDRSIKTVDRWQQRHRIPSFIYAVFKKFGDDQAGNLVALLTYFAFVSTFPLLLAMTGILGLVLKDHPELQDRISASALSEFPIIGTQLSSQLGVSSLGHSTPALLVGIIGAVLGGRGLANMLQTTLNSVWNVPRFERPGFPWNYLRTFGLLALLGVSAVVSTVAATLTGVGQIFGVSGVPIKIFAFALTIGLDTGLFLIAFRLAAAKVVSTQDLLVGAILSSVAWHILLGFAGAIIARYLKHAQAIAGFFGVVLGLLAWFGLQAMATVFAMEVDVVRSRQLWPRSITHSPLTIADKRFLESKVREEARHSDLKITVEFTEAADSPPD